MAGALKLEPKNAKHRRPAVSLPLANSLDKAVIATDLTGTVVFWNAMAERLYGWTWHEAVGRSITQLLVPASAQRDAAKIMDELRNGKSWTGEFTVRRRDGSEFVAIVTDRPMQDNEGDLIGIIGISHPKS